MPIPYFIAFFSSKQQKWFNASISTLAFKDDICSFYTNHNSKHNVMGNIWPLWLLISFWVEYCTKLYICTEINQKGMKFNSKHILNFCLWTCAGKVTYLLLNTIKRVFELQSLGDLIDWSLTLQTQISDELHYGESKCSCWSAWCGSPETVSCECDHFFFTLTKHYHGLLMSSCKRNSGSDLICIERPVH